MRSLKISLNLIVFLTLLVLLIVSQTHGQSTGGDPFGGGQRWAVVIGVSQYKFLPAEQQLKYAARDAESFAAFLRTPEGGGLDDQHIQVLLDENATARGIRSSLGTWLPRKVSDGDTVLIYFAGHGTVEETQGGGYIAGYDAEPQDLYATAISIESIRSLLQHRVNARQIVFVADADNSPHLGRTLMVDAEGNKNEINRQINQLADERVGLYTITANRTGETSRGSEVLAGGHGFFTYYLIEGLKGNAKLGLGAGNAISADEAFRYVAQAVVRETEGTMHPQQNGRFGSRIALASVVPIGRLTRSDSIARNEIPKPKVEERSEPVVEPKPAENKPESKSSVDPSNTIEKAVEPKIEPAATPPVAAAEKAAGNTREPRTTPPAVAATIERPPSVAVERNETGSRPLPNANRIDAPAPSLSAPPSPAMASFDIAIETGSLLEPRGRSAWDQYLNMVSGDSSRPELAPFKAKLSEALTAEGQRLLSRQMDPAQVELTLADYQRANSVFAKAYQLRPDDKHLNAMQHWSEGRAKILLQRYDEAQKSLQSAVELEPTSAQAHEALGIAYREQQRYFLAEREFKRASELASDWYLPHFNLAITYEAGKSEDDAIREYKAAAALYDKQPAVFARLGLLYLTQKKFAEAAEALEKSLALKPDSELYNKLGNAYFGLGRQQDASRAYRLASTTRNP